ncbi:immunoglobulin domain-containing protein [Claveliimonas bilis]|uniref:immunoglobulin domain-containing protein n=1 Tax=Claveliimonas bilis TaxID=3028070 RepID=UPI00292EDD38|nr:immunoglobulin domain-containing protein [Claveliimonas bilis]
MPVTALAADGIELYVAGQRITESGCYANQDGTWTKVEGTEPASGQFSYDAATFTLTLNQAEISYDRTLALGTKEYYGSVIAYSPSADVSLNIVVSQGTSTITGNGGIRVESTTGNASLSIKGPGSLDVEPKGSNSGITLCSSKNRNLDIDGADVTASSPALYGVYLISSTDASSTSTITVNNGSLTTGGNGNVGIYYYWSGTSNAGTSSLTVSGNAVVDTRNSQIMAQNKETVVQVGAGSDGNGGIVFNGKSGTVYGDVTLQEDLEIGNDETLTIGKDASLTVPDGKTLTNNGTINVESGGKLEGTTTGNGTLKIAPTITTQPQDVEVKENETATFNVKVTGTEPLSYQWQQSTDNGQSWTDITGETNATYTIATTTMDMSGTQYRCVVKNSIDEVTSDAALLTVKHNLVKTEYKAPTCTVNGNEEYWICENCGKYFSDANGDTEIEKDSWIISAINHSWNDAVYTWSDDGSTCTATRTCKNDSTHTETSKATVTGAQTKAPTCTEKGETTYKATFEADWAMTQTKVLADIPATGHSYGEPVWSWSEDGKTCTVTFTCEKDENHKESPKVTVTSAEKAPATCTEAGVTTYTATVKFNGKTYTDTKDLTDIPATGHSYDNGKCTVCGAIASDFKVIIAAGANGSWQKGTKDGLTFTSNAAYKYFQKVQVDGKDLDASNYTVKEGSTIVTLKAEYLETLSVGKHTLSIVSDTGTATTEFTIKAAAVTDDTQSPQTGDDSNIALWIAVLLAAGTALTGTAVYSRKRKYSK